MIIKHLLFVILFFHIISSNAQIGSSDEVSLLFYNVENLFDIKNDSLTQDDDFTPQGQMHWNEKRLNAKLINISKVILNAAGWNVPDIVALAEIENKWVVEKLIKETPLKKIPYKIIHKESPDHRGLDVALLYNSDHFYPLGYDYFPLISLKHKTEKTREILYVSGILNGADTLHIFVNHWPSRYSGVLESRPERLSAAHLLKSKIEEVLKNYKSPKIIIMGDFNDNPSDESILSVFEDYNPASEIKPDELYDLSTKWIANDQGTLKFQSQWFVFDQIIVSGVLLNAEKGWSTSGENATIVRLPFLLEEDSKYGGVKPRRTYYGFQYIGGFSDHLPVMLKLKLKD